ncbi:MAG: hypothetical protein PVF68_04005 [Acidobacteriota bacterium]|jgi:hypothetical protein
MARGFSVELRCRNCDAALRLLPLDGPAPPCPGCGAVRDLRLPEALRERGVLERCAACGDPRLYRQKDFPRSLGLAIVVAGMAASLAVLPFSPLGAYAVLFGMALLDGIVYLLLPEVAICYRCGARHRGWDPSVRPAPFDLLTADLVEHQRRQARSRGDSPG